MDVVVMHVRALSIPYVDEEDQLAVARISIRDVYHVTIRHGYNEHVITQDLAWLV